jgi:peroxiredoxin Q/BCP
MAAILPLPARLANMAAMSTLPAFSLPGSDGKTWSNQDFLGKTWILYFYPKDNTPGCTQESCDFRDAAQDLAKAGLTVVGISPDSVKSHLGFIAKQQLNFLLLSDAEHGLAEALGVWVTKMNYGREYMGIERSTFLIGPDGAIRQEWRKVKVDGHVAAVLAAAAGKPAAKPAKKPKA